MSATVVVTGTDTGVGKTHVACALVRRLRAEGLRVGVMKPVATGCEWSAAGWRNDDALALIAASGRTLVYDDVNPCAFEPPIAPHLAAAAAGVPIDRARLDAAWARLAGDSDIVVVEGAGGWLVPFDENSTFADWVGGHRWPVLLVVGLRLGCLNHALLSAQAIARTAPLAGWIGNRLPPEMPLWVENLEALRLRLPATMLACMAPTASTDTAPVLPLTANAIKDLLTAAAAATGVDAAAAARPQAHDGRS